MKLTGYQARMLFRNFRIPVPEDFITGDTEQVYQVDSQQALRVAIVTDLSARCPILRVSFLHHQAGSHQQAIDALKGLHSYQINGIASEMDFPRDHWQAFVDICMKLYRCYTGSDALYAEINPLALTAGGQLLAVNGAVSIDENAMYRQTALEAMRDGSKEAQSERLARAAGLSCVAMPGQVGCLVNGAGLAMTAMDLIDYYGAENSIRAANFVEIASSDTPERFTEALRILISDLNVKAVFINIFCGLTRCDDVAAGIVLACRQVEPACPVVIRLQGTNAAEGRRIVENSHLANITFAETMSDAAFKCVAAVKGSISHVYPD